MTAALLRRWRPAVAAACLAWLVASPAGAFAAMPAAPLPEQQTALVFGARIRYFEMGRGPTLVLVHGLGSSAEGDWGKLLRTLSATHRVLALDLLGFGASDKPFITYNVQTWVDTLGEFLRQRQVDRFTLVGESLGGWIAAQYAIQALAGEAVGPAFVLPRPARLVLSDAAGFSKTSVGRIFERGENRGPTGVTLAGGKQLLGAIFHDPAYIADEGLRSGMAWSIAKGDGWTIQSFYGNRSIVDEAVAERLGVITIPTLVVWGQDDRLVPLDDGQGYAAGIPGARLVVIPDCGHAPMIEAPERFLKAVEAFL